MPSAMMPFDGVRTVQLPPLRSADADFSGLVMEDGRPLDDAGKAARRDALIATFDDVRPDVLVIEAFPFGRRQMRFELLPLLERARARRPRPLVACSIRDILQRRKPEREAETVATVDAFFDAVLVHGDPAVHRLEGSFGPADAIANKVAYTGYVAPVPPPPAPHREGVVVSAGGGAVGGPLLHAAVDARARSGLADAPWLLLTGDNLPDEDFARLSARAGIGLTVARHRSEFLACLAGARASISQAGYNTVMDVLVTQTPAVLVPFAGSGETEQPERAAALAARGRAEVVREADLDADALAAAVDKAVTLPPAAVGALDLDGARGTVAAIETLHRSR